MSRSQPRLERPRWLHGREQCDARTERAFPRRLKSERLFSRDASFAPPGRGVRSQYNGLHPASRSWGIDSPCCVRFERRTLSFAHALVGTVVCVACGVLPKFWNTYLGHIGPASVMFILSELERFPGPTPS